MSFATVMMPLFVEVFLTFALLFWAGALRSGDLRAGTVKPEEIGLRELNWPQRTAQVSNAYSNQTELPTLFYVLTILAYFTHHAGTVFVVLALPQLNIMPAAKRAIHRNFIPVVYHLAAVIHVLTNHVIRTANRNRKRPC